MDYELPTENPSGGYGFLATAEPCAKPRCKKTMRPCSRRVWIVDLSTRIARCLMEETSSNGAAQKGKQLAPICWIRPHDG